MKAVLTPISVVYLIISAGQLFCGVIIQVQKRFDHQATEDCKIEARISYAFPAYNLGCWLGKNKDDK